MVTASVKGIDGKGAGYGPRKAGAATGPGDAFQALLGQQTEKDAGKNVKNKQDEISTASQPDGLKQYGKNRVLEEKTRKADGGEEDTADQKDGMDPQVEAVSVLFQEIARILEVTPEELQTLAEDAGISLEELPGNEELTVLAAFADARLRGGDASEADAAMALATDETLYERYTRILEARDEFASRIPQEVMGDAEEALSREMTGEVLQPPQVTARDEKPAELPDEDDPAMEKIPVATNVTEAEPPLERQRGGESREKGGAFQEQGMLQEGFQVSDTAEMIGEGEAYEESPVTDTQSIMRQIMDFMKVQIRPQVTSLEMQLHPASLGTIQVKILSRAGSITASFTAQSETVKAALESQMVTLKEQFEQQGIRVDAIEVEVHTNAFQENLGDRGAGQRNNQTGEPRRNRRLRTDMLTEEQLENLTSDMDSHGIPLGNGGTIDYTV